MTQQPLSGMETLALRSPSVEEILLMAVDKNADTQAIERLVNLKLQLDARQDEREFNEAMSAVQSELEPVRADAVNPQTKSKYATYVQLHRKVAPIYQKQGFALSFSTTDCPITEHVRVICYVTRGGHTRTYQCDMPCDGKGAKGGDVMTKTHASGSAQSYGMRYLLKMIFNIAVGEDDDDGNGGIEAFEDLDWIASAKDMDELKRLYFQAKAKAQRMNSSRLIRLIEEAKDKRKAELL